MYLNDPQWHTLVYASLSHVEEEDEDVGATYVLSLLAKSHSRASRILNVAHVSMQPYHRSESSEEYVSYLWGVLQKRLARSTSSATERPA